MMERTLVTTVALGMALLPTSANGATGGLDSAGKPA